MKILKNITFCVFTILVFSGCDSPVSEKITQKQKFENYHEAGDLDKLALHGRLRILVPSSDDIYLPRNGYPPRIEQEMVTEFARQLKLEPVIVGIDGYSRLIPSLLAGRGDIIAANMTVTEERLQKVSFSFPIAHSTEYVVKRSSDTKLASPEDLNGRQIFVRTGTSFYNTAMELKKKYPLMQIKELDGVKSTNEILDMLSDGVIDLCIQDSNIMDVVTKYRDDITPAFKVSAERPLAWAIRPGARALLGKLNNFITQEKLTKPKVQISRDDFEAIKKRKVIRFLTCNNLASYFLYKGELFGFEYELARAFAKQHDLRLEVITASSTEDLEKMLLDGKGDIAGCFLKPGLLFNESEIAFSYPYYYSSEMLIGKESDNYIKNIDEIEGRSVVVPRSSHSWKTLETLLSEGKKFTLLSAPEELEPEELISKVASGDYDLIVTDNHILNIELAWKDYNIKGLFPLTQPEPQSWVVRKNNPELLTEVNNFLKKEYKSLFYNMIYQKYFRNEHTKMFKNGDIPEKMPDSLSPFDDLVKKYAEKYNFDWRLLISQMYQESHFDPKAESWAGARGLMQVMPNTAQGLGIEDSLEDTETGIHAGVKYLSMIREMFDPFLSVQDRMWFTLAAYNSGPGHVEDARRLARKKGWNPNRWFDNVETALLLLSKKDYARQSRHGYVRGHESVKYVRQIRSRYNAYIALSKPGRINISSR